ncbi:hypothetical protein ACFCX4_01400 [Kitasatospora sp. NPDC056327]|uniref:hypothetical protein n=1 Tax=Kitasatospora sp. NPDC056327 TaxID=3345785 RepID=UPI0035D8654E
MTWLRVLTALAVLTAAAGLVAVFARWTDPARGDRADGTGRRERTGHTGRAGRREHGTPEDRLRAEAERSGLIRPMDDGN